MSGWWSNGAARGGRKKLLLGERLADPHLHTRTHSDHPRCHSRGAWEMLRSVYSRCRPSADEQIPGHATADR